MLDGGDMLKHHEQLRIDLWKQRKLYDKIQIWEQFLSQLNLLKIPHDKVRHHLSHVLDQHGVGYAVA